MVTPFFRARVRFVKYLILFISVILLSIAEGFGIILWLRESYRQSQSQLTENQATTDETMSEDGAASGESGGEATGTEGETSEPANEVVAEVSPAPSSESLQEAEPTTSSPEPVPSSEAVQSPEAEQKSDTAEPAVPPNTAGHEQNSQNQTPAPAEPVAEPVAEVPMDDPDSKPTSVDEPTDSVSAKDDLAATAQTDPGDLGTDNQNSAEEFKDAVSSEMASDSIAEEMITSITSGEESPIKDIFLPDIDEAQTLPTLPPESSENDISFEIPDADTVALQQQHLSLADQEKAKKIVISDEKTPSQDIDYSEEFHNISPQAVEVFGKDFDFSILSSKSGTAPKHEPATDTASSTLLQTVDLGSGAFRTDCGVLSSEHSVEWQSSDLLSTNSTEIQYQLPDGWNDESVITPEGQFSSDRNVSEICFPSMQSLENLPTKGDGVPQN